MKSIKNAKKAKLCHEFFCIRNFFVDQNWCFCSDTNFKALFYVKDFGSLKISVLNV